MADEEERRRVDRSEASWQRLLDLVPAQSLVAPVPAPVPEPVPDPESDAKVRAIQLEILNDRKAADQKIRDIQKQAQKDALESIQRMNEAQRKMNL